MGENITQKLLIAVFIVALSVSVTHARTVVKADFYGSLSAKETIHTLRLNDPPITWPICLGVQQTGVVSASFDASGTFGTGYIYTYNYSPLPWASFETPPDSKHEYLFGAALWVGGIIGDDTLVSVGFDGWYGLREMVPENGLGKPSVSKLENISDFSMRAGIVDTLTMSFVNPEHNPLNIHLANRSHIWRESPYDNCIVYDLVITNIGDQAIESGYCAILADSDVLNTSDGYDGWDDDLAGSLREQGLGYVIDNDGEPVNGIYSDETSLTKAFALKFLGSSFVATDTNYHWLVHNGDSRLDFSPRQKADSTTYCNAAVGTPRCDSDMYHMMSYPEWDYDLVYTATIDSLDPIWRYPRTQWILQDLTDGLDVSILMSIGPFDLLPDSSVRIQYTMFTVDSIHTDPDNISNLNWPAYDPDAYLASLNLDRLIPIANAAAEKAATLFDPMLPPTGLTASARDASSVTVNWDPWVLDGLDGYDLFLTPIDPRDLPHQGLIPSWWQTDEPLFTKSIAVANGATISISDSTIPYLVQTRHRTESETGQISLPLILNPFHRLQPPLFATKYLFVNNNKVATIEWTATDDPVDHFNIYHILADHPYGVPHEPFYSYNREAGPLGPVDSIWQDGYYQYYFAMAVDSQLTGDVRSIQMQVNDNDMIVITSVDQYGFESEMNSAVICKVIPQRTAEILYLTTVRISPDPPRSPWEPRIDSIMSGAGLSYDILVVRPNLIQPTFHVTLEFAELVGYQWVIIDEDPIGVANMDWYPALDMYVQSGGNLACFSYEGLNNGGPSVRWQPGTLPERLGYDLGQYFDIDSALYAGLTFYDDPVPTIDTICGFESALSIDDQFPSVSYDTSVSPHDDYWSTNVWPPGTPTSVTVYDPGGRSTTTHLFQSLYPEQSIMHGLPIGLKTITEDEYGSHQTYTFGFHLHQMKVEEARQFVVALTDAPECCGRYTGGMTGNVDCDEEGRMDIVDIVTLIDRIYLSKQLLCCDKNGNISGDQNNQLNLVDLVRLIDHLYLSKDITAPCQ